MSHEQQPLWVALEWIPRHCIVPDGFRKGRPFRPYDYQFQHLAAFYLVRGDVEFDPENPIRAAAFLYRRALLVGPQKVGKNPEIAAQICLEGVGPSLFAGWAVGGEVYRCSEWGCGCGWLYRYKPGEPMGIPRPTPLVEITAYSEASTDNTYLALRPMIDQGPLHDVIPHTGENFMRLPDLYGVGFDPDQSCRINTVTSSPGSRLGGRVTFAAQDELGIWTPLNGMVKLADTQYRNLAGMGGRASLTTNAWDPSQHSVAQREYESSAIDIYRQFVQPPKNLSYSDKRDRHKIHRIVYPLDTRRENGGHVELESIEAEAAGLVEHDPAQAARFFGNMLVAGAGAAVDPEHFDSLASPRDVPRGTRIGAGFDGSISDDATFLRGCTAEGYRFTIGSWPRPVGDELARWQREHPREEWRVPRLDVEERIAWMFETYDVGRLFYDPPKWWTEGERWTARWPNRVLAFDTNQARRFAPAVDRWRTAIRETIAATPVAGDYRHDGDPVASDHVKAAHLKKVRTGDPDLDRRTMHVIVKGEDRRKIDAAVADVLASEAMATMPPPDPTPIRSRVLVTF